MNLKVFKSESGQSLAELLIALAVGGFFLISSAVAITIVLRNDTEAKNVQTATFLSQNEIDSVQSVSESNWLTLYNLAKGASAQYFVIPSATSTASTTVISGRESVLADDVTNGLVGYWKFDEGAGTKAYDFSGNGYNGTSASFPAWTASSSCKVGGCLTFDGNSTYVDLGNNSGLSITGAITISAWVNYSGAGNIDVVSKTTVSNGYGPYTLAFSNTSQVFGESSDNSSWGTLIVVSNSYPLGWHHVVATDDGLIAKLYVDGVLIGSDNTPVASKTVITEHTMIGWYDGAAYNRFFNGKIDDVRIYNRALSAAEISQLYKSSVFSRYFSVENVNRDSCGAGNISSDAVTFCLGGPFTSGVAEDPSTQKITSHIEWQNGGNLSRAEYISRSVNRIIDETDWSGGSGQSGVINSPNGRYDTSNNISTSTGSIRLQGL